MTLLVAAAFAQDLVDKHTTVVALPPRDVLTAGLANVDVAVRREAMGALLGAEADPCASPLVQRGRYDPSEYVQRAVIETIGAHCPAVMWAWATDTELDATTRALAAAASGEKDPAKLGEQALRLRSDGRAAPYLVVAANAGNAEAATRLAQLAHAGNLPLEQAFYFDLVVKSPTFPFADALREAEPEARPWLATSWFFADPHHGRGAAVRAIHAADLDLRLDAVEALRDHPEAHALLVWAPGLDARLATGLFPKLAVKSLDDPDLDRRVDAIATLGRSPAPEDHATLRKLAADADLDEPVRVAVARALAVAPLPEDRGALTAYLTDESPVVRVVAAARLLRPE